MGCISYLTTFFPICVPGMTAVMDKVHLTNLKDVNTHAQTEKI